eukprot:EC799200.1.p1 GENE.EC799200.1~~EC799200.1.p1  ORF type:complete len:179 (+),score=30.77 EC799200.1:154-690(+)
MCSSLTPTPPSVCWCSLATVESVKTTTMSVLAERAWRQWQTRESRRVPVRVPLGALRNADERLLEEALERLSPELGLESDVRRLKEEPLLLMLDGYDELYRGVNLFVKNQLDVCRDVKVIITCRGDYALTVLGGVTQYRRYFAPVDARGQLCMQQLMERHIAPFNKSRLRSTLSDWCK